MENITAFTTPEPIDHAGLYNQFIERESGASGTVVIHHGRVKRPGKQVPDFSAVELAAVGPPADAYLEAVAREATDRFGLNQVLIVHRLGRVSAGDSVLLAIVSSASRGPAFAACAWIVDEIKKEEFITLTELP